MQLLTKPITLSTLTEIAEQRFGEMTKAVVDIEKKIMVVDADLHADQEAELLSHGSEQKNLWGINLYPELFDEEDFIEFDSMINLRPSQNNRTRGIDDMKIQEKIRAIVKTLVTP